MKTHYHSPYLVVGTGLTGCSVIDFLQKNHCEVSAFDTRTNPPHLPTFEKTYPDVPLYLGQMESAQLSKFQTIVLSPGISPETPTIIQAKELNIPVIGDIELYAQYVSTPVIAITGSNGKSTVTTLVGELLRGSGHKVAVGGNIGIPALSMLDEEADFHVLELSSFQLETVQSLQPVIATILNISPDHLDRHKTMDAYIEAKQRIYQQAERVVYYQDDLQTQPNKACAGITFGLNQHQVGGFGLVNENTQSYIVYGEQKICSISELPLIGTHNVVNVLAALTICHALDCPIDKMVESLKTFQGLKHRCQKIAEFKQTIWINDSKGTNPHSTIAAIEGIGQNIQGKIILIAGGKAKDSDFTVLKPFVRRFVKHIILIGQDAPILEAQLCEDAPCEDVNTLENAVKLAETLIEEGDAVLLSPACTSWDQYQSFAARGDEFVSQVQSLKG